LVFVPAKLTQLGTLGTLPPSSTALAYMPNEEQSQDILNPSKDEGAEEAELNLVDDADDEDEAPADLGGEEPTKEESDEPDYKALFEAETEKLKLMTSVNRKLGGALREARKKGVAENEQAVTEPSEDKQEESNTEFDRFYQERLNDEVDDLLDDMVENDDERKLVKLYYQNRIVPTGYSRRAIREDLESARILANKGRLAKKREEQAHRGQAQKVAMGAASVARRTVTDAETSRPKLTKGEYKLLKRFGMKDADIRKKFSS